MRLTRFWVLGVVGMTVMGGCAGEEIDIRPINTAEIDGLAVSLEVSKRTFDPGETFTVTVIAQNRTQRAMRIVAASGALVHMRIWRHTGLGWEEVKRYPQAATTALTPWTLKGNSARRFALQLTVQPDWPTGELLRLTGELNGKAEASPGITIEVAPTP